MTEHDHSQCRSLLGHLSDYMDGDLSQDLCEQIEKHLAECQDCNVVVDTLRKTIFLYHAEAAEQAEIPGGVRKRLFRTLNLDDTIPY